MPVNCGVPQGSILGPILFTLAVNDLLTTFPSSYAYADDTLIFTEGTTIEQSRNSCKLLLDQVKNWYQTNLLQLNLSKVKYCIFANRHVSDPVTIATEGTNIKSENTLTILGVPLDINLSFDSHVDKLRKTSCAKKILFLT